MIFHVLASIILFLISLFCYFYLKFQQTKHLKFEKNKKINVVTVAGSGGHTTELIRLLKTLESEIESARIYFYVADTDKHSMNKIEKFVEDSKMVKFAKVIKTPRAREVGQSYLTSIFSTLKQTAFCVKPIILQNPDFVLVNGPGTCLPILLLCLLNGFVRGKRCSTIFVESFCRVQEMSLTGAIIYNFRLVDKLFVQWPELAGKFPRANYVGRIL